MREKRLWKIKMNNKLRRIYCALLLRYVEVDEEVLFEDLDKTEVKLKVIEQEECVGCYFIGRCLGVPCEPFNREFGDNSVIYK